MTTPTTTTNGAAPTGAASALPEAPAAASVKAVDPAGFEWIVTLRTTSAAELLPRVEYMTTWLTSHQWTPAAARPASAAAATADAPICPTHNVPMKQGRRGWYCPTKILDDGGDGRPVYCKVTR